MKKLLLFIFISIFSFSFSFAQSTVNWNFNSASPSSGVPAHVTVSAISQGNNNGITTLMDGGDASNGYTGASGGSNAAMAAKTQDLDAATSSYYQVTFTPDAGYAVKISSIQFGYWETRVGPGAFAVRSSTDNYAADVANVGLSADVAWHNTGLVSFTGTVASPLGAPVTLRIYGFGRNPPAGRDTPNWRIDDLNLVVSFVGIPTVSTTAATNVGGLSATLGGNATADGGISISDRGVVYSSTNTTPTISNSKVQIGSGTGSFSQSVTGLTPGTNYYARAYATNIPGTAYGSVATFRTTVGATGASASTADGSYKAGSTINITVNFSDPVNVTGTPQLKLETGTTDQTINYTSGSGTNALTFAYVVQAGDKSTDLDYFNTAALTLNGGTIKQTSNSVDAILTLPAPGTTGSLGASKNIIIDTQAPTAGIVVASPALNIGQTSTVTFTFSEVVTGFTNSDINVPNGTLSTVSTSDGGKTYTATLTPTADITDATNLIAVADASVTDVAGNAISGSTNSNNYTIDTARPTVTIAITSAIRAGQTPTVTFTFSEAVTGFTTSDLTVSNGAVTNLTTSDNITFTGTFTPTASNTSANNVITLANTGVADAAGNAGTGTTSSNNYAIDTTPPTLAITSNVSALKIGETATITFTFSEDPGSTFTWDGSTGDVAVSGGTLGAITGSGLTRTATFTPTDGVNGATASITVAANTYQDAAGNNGGAGSTPAVAIDTQAPTTTIAGAGLSADTGPSNSDFITNTSAQTISGTLSANLLSGETVQVSINNGSSYNNATASTNAWSLSGVAITGSNTIKVRVVDAAGNAGTEFSKAYVLDQTGPSLAITSNASALKAGQTATITFTFSENPTTTFTWDGSSGDVSVSGGTLGAISGSGLTRTATFTPTASANGTASITVAASAYTDAAGNNGSAGTTPAITFDTKIPTVTILVADNALKIGETSQVTFTFSEAVTGFDNADLTIGNGSLSAVSSTDNITWTANFTPTAGVTSATNVITLANTGVSDAAGNTGSGTTNSNNYAIDVVAPTLAITSNVSALKVGETATITFTFSEDPASTFTWDGSAGDVTVSGGTLGAISGSGLTRTATFTPTAATNGGTASITVAANTYQDAAGNNGGAGTTPTLTFDTQAPAAPSVADLATSSDTGTSSADNLTKATTPTFTGTAEAGATVKLYDTDGTTVLGHITATGGNWSITSSTLAAGSHTITSTATDAAGNTSAVSTGLAITIDTTSPTLAITSNVSALKIGETATISFTFSEDPGTTFTWDGSAGDVTVSGGTLGAISGSGLAYTATFTPTASTNGGTASITVAAASYTDAAGNNGGAGTTPSLIFDTNAPAAPTALALASGSDTGTSGSDNLINTTTPTVTGNAEAGSTVVLYDTDGTTALGTGTAPGGTWSITSSALTAGSHTLTAKTTDAAGNTSSASSGLAITIDTTSPTLAITSNVSALKIGETATITFTFSEAPGTTFTWDGSAGDIVVSGGTLGAISGSGLTRTATFTPTSSTNGGTASITVAAASYTDAAGNNGGAGTTPSLTFDTQAPAAPSIADLATSSDSGTSSTDNLTNAITPTFTGTAEAGSTVKLYDTDGTTMLGSATATGGNWSITSSTLAAGSHTITSTTTDAAGNTGAVSTGLAITIDTISPTLAITSNVSALKIGETATITFTFSEDPGTTFAWDGSAGDIVVSGGALGAISGSGLTRTATFTPTAATNNGTVSITVAAASYTDAAGNTGGAGTAPSLSFDTKAPNAPSAADLATANDSGTSSTDNLTNATMPTFTGTAEAGSTVKLYDTNGTTVLGSTTATGGNWSVTSSILASGTHTITSKATDVAGNTGAASSGLSITIDFTAPGLPVVLTPVNNTTIVTATPAITGTAEANALVTINIDNAVATTVTANGSGNWTYTTPDLSNGSHTVKALATDAAGNASTYGTANAFIVNINPTISSTAIDAMSNTYGTASASTSFTVSGTNMTEGILVTPPVGFEVSKNDVSFSNTVTAGTGGMISELVYIRLKSTTAAGPHNGDVKLSSAGATDLAVTVPNSVVSKRILNVTATGINKVYNSNTTATVTLNDDRVTGDTFTTTYAATFDNKNFGTGKAVSVSSIAITGGASANYTLGNTTASTTAAITRRTLTVTTAGINKEYDGNTTATVTLSDNRVSGDTFTTTYAATFDNKNAGTGKAVSVSNIAITGGLSANYTLGNTTASTTAAITAAPLTVTAKGPAKPYGTVLSTITTTNASYFEVSATKNSEVVSSVKLTPDADAISATTPAGHHYIITPSDAAGTGFSATNYAINYVNYDGVVAITGQIITFDPLTTVTYGNTAPTLSGVSASSGLTVTFTSSDPKVATVSGNTLAIVGAGTTTITASQAGDNNFTPAAPIQQDLTVRVRAVTITAASRSKTYGEADPALTYSVTGGNLVNNDAFTGTLIRDAGENVGVYAIQQGSVALSSNYALTYTSANLSIGTRPIAITAAAKSKIFGEADPALTYSITSGNLVNNETFTGSLIRDPGENIGTYVIKQGSVALSNNYSLAYTGANLNIQSAARTITFNQLPVKIYGDADFAPGASISNGDTPVYTSSNTAVAIIVNGNIHIIGAGIATISASSPNNTNFLAATPITQLLIVNKAIQIITFAIIPTQNRGGSYDLSVIKSNSGLPVTITTNDPMIASITGQTLNALRIGMVHIVASQAGNANYLPATISQDVFVQDPAGNEIIVHQAMSPNGDGINDILYIEGIGEHPDNRVTLIDRNGVKIFEIIGYNNSTRVFDGHSNRTGAFMQQGTYFYLVEYTVNNEGRHKTGYFVIKYH